MNQELKISYVYLLVTKDKKSFKIGKANNVLTKIKQLNKDSEFDLKESYIIEVNYEKALDLKLILNDLYCNFKKEGFRNYFDIHCIKHTFKFIEVLNEISYSKIINYNDFIKNK